MTRVLLRIAVAAIVLVWLLGRVDLAAVGTAIATAAPLAIVIATLTSFLGNVTIAVRLRLLLAAQGVRARVRQTLAVNLAAFFYNLFLPVVGVGFWLADPHPKPTGSLLVLLLGTATLGVLVAPRAVPHELRRFVRELTAGGSGTWWSAVLHRLSHGLGSVARIPPAALARIVGISILAQMPGVIVFVALGHGLDLPVPAVSWGWIRSLVVLLTVLPISIGGIGVREGALVLVLAGFGVPAHEALALSILVFATTILAPGLLGGIIEGADWLRDGGRR